jgi:elongation factor P
MLESGDLKKGLKIIYEGSPHVISQFDFVKPGKGQALYKCRLKNMLTGSQFEKTFRSGEKIEKADLEELDMEYLYYDGDKYCFMNTNTYEQVFLTEEQIGKENTGFLKENIVCKILFFESTPIGVTLPNFIDLKIVETEPWAKGDTATNDTKPAKLETGETVQVPPFIGQDEMIWIDTRTGQYSERVKK